MKDFNQERGAMMFTQKIGQAIAAANLSANGARRLFLLQAGFGQQVGVMPTDSLMSAVKLAQACVGAADSECSDDALVSEALSRYLVLQGGGPTADIGRKEKGAKFGAFGVITEAQLSDTQEKIQSRLEAQIADIAYTSADADDDSDTAVEMHVIDLLGDAPKSDVAIEGQRRLGLVDAKLNVTETTEDIVLGDDKVVYGKVHYDDQHNVEKIECPRCGATDVYSAGLNKFGCFGCECEFLVDMGLESYFDTVCPSCDSTDIRALGAGRFMCNACRAQFCDEETDDAGPPQIIIARG